MYAKRYSVTIVVSTLFIFFCFTTAVCWSKSYSPNVHWVFCIDTSGSMKMKGHVDLLKLITQKITAEFIEVKKNIIKTGDRITIFSFDEDVRLEVTSLYQTENDLRQIRYKLKEMNKRNGNLTFISEAIVQAIDLVNKYDRFFDTNALYVFTDGKSEPYSPKWSKTKIRDRKRRDTENFKKISLVGKEHGLNIWLGVLKWDAFDDAKSFVKKMGKGGHLVDLTDFNRLSLEKALTNFAETVRTTVRLAEVGDIDLGNIPYKTNPAYEKNVSLSIQTDRANGHPSIMGRINLDPENPFEAAHEYPLAIRTTEDKMVLNFRIDEADQLKPGTYKGKLNLYPSQLHFGALAIEPSQLNVVFKKSGFLSFYFWRVLVIVVIGSLFLIYLTNKIKRKMPVKL